jgi:cathepsin L
MKTFAAVATLGAITSATMMQQADYDFMRYVSTFNKMYATVEEFTLRQENFAAFDAFVQASNANANSPSSYRAGHNFLSDWTTEEKNQLLGLKDMPLEDDLEEVDTVEDVNLATAFNWCDEGKCTAVKDQK